MFSLSVDKMHNNEMGFINEKYDECQQQQKNWTNKNENK